MGLQDVCYYVQRVKVVVRRTKDNGGCSLQREEESDEGGEREREGILVSEVRIGERDI